MVALVLILISVGSYYFFNKRTIIAEEKPMLILSGCSDELLTTEQKYKNQVDNKLILLREKEIYYNNLNFFDDFIRQIEELDKQCYVFQAELNQQNCNERIAKEILNYYELKLMTLDMLEIEIDKINNLIKNNGNENKPVYLSL